MELRSSNKLDNEELSVDDLSDLEAVSHFYSLTQINEQMSDDEARMWQQAGNVYEQLKDYREAKSSRRPERVLSEGADLWAEMCIYWDEAGMYDIDGLAAVTPVLQAYGDLDMDVEKAEDIGEVKDILDEGIKYFEPQN